MREKEGVVIYDDFQFNYREAAIGRDNYRQSAISHWMLTSAGVSKLLHQVWIIYKMLVC